jgi:hypothetical protein
MLTKKDYELIALAIKKERDVIRDFDEDDPALIVIKHDVIYNLTHRLSIVLKVDNPRFDVSKFKEACGF